MAAAGKRGEGSSQLEVLTTAQVDYEHVDSGPKNARMLTHLLQHTTSITLLLRETKYSRDINVFDTAKYFLS